MKRIAVCTWLAWAGLAGCNSDSNGGPTDDSAIKGTVQFSVLGTASFARPWQLDAYQMPHPLGPDYSKSIRLSFESSLATPADQDSLRVYVVLSSDGYTAPRAYQCGINQQIQSLCGIQLMHYLNASTYPGVWGLGPNIGPHPNCTFTIAQDDASGFNGAVQCEIMHFRTDLDPAKYNLNHPDATNRVDISGSWSFKQRLIYGS